MIQSLRRCKMTFGEKLKLLYQSRGLTQKQLAAEICVSRSAIAKWVSGRGIPCEENIKELCRYFGVEEAWLFGTERHGCSGRRISAREWRLRACPQTGAEGFRCRLFRLEYRSALHPHILFRCGPPLRVCLSVLLDAPRSGGLHVGYRRRRAHSL